MRRRFTETDTDAFGVRAEINVTSLVDVAFTLLIIFMITAPILQGGIEIDVPEAAAGPLSTSEALVISIDGSGQIFLDDVEVTFEEFDGTIEQVLGRREERDVFVKADQTLQFGVVARVMGRLQQAGATAVNLVTNPDSRRQP